jgi:regulatory protein YycI of two-component signal transduction system YycFG
MKRGSTKIKSLFIVGIVLLIVGVGLYFFFNRNNNSTGQGSQSSASAARATENVNKDFNFPISKEKDANTLKMTIEKAEFVDEIVVKGQKASAVPGRTFLILSVKLMNPSEQTIKMDTRNYVRLSVNKNDSEFLAPEIHNDPVEIQAISTKLTRLGFPVNTTDRDFVLQVGEIKGDKEKIELTIKP